jgi:hypothetical protein
MKKYKIGIKWYNFTKKKDYSGRSNYSN